MSLLQAIHNATADTDEEEDDKFAGISNDLLGHRNKVAAPIFTEEPGDHEAPTTTFDQNQLRQGREFLSQNGFYPQEFRRDAGIDINDEYLRSLAKMKVASLNLKAKLRTEPVKLVAVYGFKYIGNTEKSEAIKKLNVADKIGQFNELLEEVVFQELKALQRVNNLRIPTGEELMGHYTMMFYNELAGDGFENVLALGEGIIQKVKKK